MTDFRSAIRQAVAIVGGQAKLAAQIGCAQSEVSRLCKSAASVSPQIAIAISRATGGKVLIRDMLPDVVEAVAKELGEPFTAPDEPPVSPEVLRNATEYALKGDRAVMEKLARQADKLAERNDRAVKDLTGEGGDK